MALDSHLLPVVSVAASVSEDSSNDAVATRLTEKVSKVVRVSSRQQLLNLSGIDAVVLDAGIDWVSSNSLVADVRSRLPNSAIVVVSNEFNEESQIGFFRSGADDVVAKPVNYSLFPLRLNAIITSYRSHALENYERLLEADGLVVDLIRHRVLIDGREISCTPNEFCILKILMSESPGSVVDRFKLLERAVHNQFITERTVDVHIRALRRKFGERSDLIETIRGVGYRIARRTQGNGRSTGSQIEHQSWPAASR
jgi:two-component system phosphate regulon response regulator PhoB